jgi:hypothetical protein
MAVKQKISEKRETVIIKPTDEKNSVGLQGDPDEDIDGESLNNSREE